MAYVVEANFLGQELLVFGCAKVECLQQEEDEAERFGKHPVHNCRSIETVQVSKGVVI